MASQELKLDVKGLVTSPNPFGAAPSGSLAVADDVIIRNAGIVESRRGFSRHSTFSGGRRIHSFQEKLLGLANTTLSYYASGAWNALPGTYTGPDVDTPVRFFEVAKGLFFTTDTGVYKMSAYNSDPVTAGLPRAMPVYSAVATHYNGSASPFANNTSSAYRLVYTYVDAQQNLILGPPSGRFVAENTSGLTAGYLLTMMPVPNVTQAGWSIRIYRSVAAISPAEPSDELYLAGEYTLTQDDINLGVVRFADITADNDLGVALYTNQNAEGAGQENNAPPIARDACTFKGTTIYANTTDFRRLTVTLRPTANASSGAQIRNADRVTISDGTNSDIYTAALTEDNGVNLKFLAASGYPYATSASSGLNTTTPAESIESFARVINTTTFKTVPLQAFAVGNTLILESAQPLTAPLTVTFSAIPQASAVLSRSGFIVNVSMALCPFGIGDQVLMASSNPDSNFPVGVKTVTAVTSASFSYRDSTSTIPLSTTHSYTATHYRPELAWSPTAPSSNIEGRNPAALRYSKFNQPEACPLEDEDIVGDEQQAILRVIPLRDSVLIFKEDGLYKLTGTGPEDFVIQPYDLTLKLAAPESAVAMSDYVFCWTTQGVQAVGESTGASTLSNDINGTLSEIYGSNSDVASTAFAVPYQAEQQYLLWLPDAGTNPGFAYTWPITFGAGQAYVFNGFTQTWTRYAVSASHGIIDPTTGKLVLVDGGQVLEERKDYTATDYQDIGGTANITAVTNSTHITMSGPGVGDLITQGSSSARVLSVGLGNALTLDTAGSWSVASATYARAIPCEVQWLPATGENPGIIKQFRETSLNFRLGQFTTIGATFSTDVDPTTSTSLRYGSPTKPANVNVRTLVPVNKARGTHINAGFTHRQACANFQLQSCSLIYRPVSTKTPSHSGG